MTIEIDDKLYNAVQKSLEITSKSEKLKRNLSGVESFIKLATEKLIFDDIDYGIRWSTLLLKEYQVNRYTPEEKDELFAEANAINDACEGLIELKKNYRSDKTA